MPLDKLPPGAKPTPFKIAKELEKSQKKSVGTDASGRTIIKTQAPKQKSMGIKRIWTTFISFLRGIKNFFLKPLRGRVKSKDSPKPDEQKAANYIAQEVLQTKNKEFNAFRNEVHKTVFGKLGEGELRLYRLQKAEKLILQKIDSLSENQKEELKLDIEPFFYFPEFREDDKEFASYLINILDASKEEIEKLLLTSRVNDIHAGLDEIYKDFVTSSPRQEKESFQSDIFQEVEEKINNYLDQYIFEEKKVRDQPPISETVVEELGSLSEDEKSQVLNAAYKFYLDKSILGIYVLMERISDIRPDTDEMEIIVQASIPAIKHDFPHLNKSEDELRKDIKERLPIVNLLRKQSTIKAMDYPIPTTPPAGKDQAYLDWLKAQGKTFGSPEDFEKFSNEWNK